MSTVANRLFSNMIGAMFLLSFCISMLTFSVSASELGPHQDHRLESWNSGDSMERRTTKAHRPIFDRWSNCPHGCPFSMDMMQGEVDQHTIEDHEIEGNDVNSGVVFVVVGHGVSYKNFAPNHNGAKAWGKACKQAVYEAYSRKPFRLDSRRDYLSTFNTGCIQSMCTTTTGVLLGFCTLISVDAGTLNNAKNVETGFDLSHLTVKRMRHVSRIMSVKDLYTAPQQLMKGKRSVTAPVLFSSLKEHP